VVTVAEIFQTYFIDPIVYNTGYNIVNTATYAIVLIAAVFLTYKMLKKMDVRIDRSFLFGIVPFVALGGIMRAWEDLLEATGTTQSLTNSIFSNFVIIDAAGVARNMLLVSPVIYITMFAIALVSLLIAKGIEKFGKISYYKTWFAIGIILDIIILAQLRLTVLFAFYAVVFFTVLWIFIILAAKEISIKKNVAKLSKLLTNENTFLLDVHMFDATTTFVALNYFGYFEQHVVPNILISIFGPASMYLLKLVVVSVVLYYFDKELSKPEDAEKRTFLKIIVLILGLGPGLRNFLRMIMGV
jgi:uncharacterized membrane protein